VISWDGEAVLDGGGLESWASRDGCEPGLVIWDSGLRGVRLVLQFFLYLREPWRM
jgi:hypothetical protein